MTAERRTLDALLADPGVAGVLRSVRRDAAESDPDITTVEFDSRRVGPGSLFCCVPGERFDGHDFAAAAVAQGAVALLVSRPLEIDVPQLLVDDVRHSMALLAAAFHGHPSRALRLVGVTGTNGKTTTTSLIAAVLDHAGQRTGLIGTLSGVHTTPEAPDLQRRLAEFRDTGCDAVVMEVSSHALHLGRVTGCHFDLAVFTNLGRDHLDLHGTLERYFAAKASLFEPVLSQRGLTNVDDVHGRLLAEAATIPMHRFSLDDVTDVQVTPTSHAYTWRGQRVQVAMGGTFNVMNSLAAAEAAVLLGIEPSTVAAGLARAASVPGRFEPVRGGQAFDVIVDYAHTPDGIRAVLESVRSVTEGRIIVVFGCGGDRDREKRPEMGEVAARLADMVVVTSDNPRSEDPDAIINAITAGVPEDYRQRVVSQPDRRRALATAFASALPGDVVVVAGKGHETTQTIGSSVLPFDDRAVSRELLGGSQ